MKFGSSKMAVAFSSPSLGHLKTQRKTVEKTVRDYWPQSGQEKKMTPKRPGDPNQLAKSIIDIATGQASERHTEGLAHYGVETPAGA
jgi:hypothetical protein